MSELLEKARAFDPSKMKPRKTTWAPLQENAQIDEDGHQDVSSAIRQCKTTIEDAQDMLQKLQTINPEDSLPSWWTNKLAVVSSSMNKMRDYLLVPSVSEEVELDEQKVGDPVSFEDSKNKLSFIEEVDLDEDIATMAMVVMGLNAAALLPVLFMSVREIIRGTPLESSIKNVVDKLKKNKNYKMSDSEKSDVKGFVSKVKKDKPSLLQKAVKQAKLNLLKDQSHEEVEEGAAADARRAMRNDPDMKQRAFSKDVSSTDDDEKAASKNIMMQLRKAVSLRSYDVEFADGKKQKVDQRIAQAVQNKYNKMRRPADKEKFQAQIAKSYKDMLKTIKSGYGEQKESILEKIDRKIKENKNG